MKQPGECLKDVLSVIEEKKNMFGGGGGRDYLQVEIDIGTSTQVREVAT